MYERMQFLTKKFQGAAEGGRQEASCSFLLLKCATALRIAYVKSNTHLCTYSHMYTHMCTWLRVLPALCRCPALAPPYQKRRPTKEKRPKGMRAFVSACLLRLELHHHHHLQADTIPARCVYVCVVQIMQCSWTVPNS